MQVSCHIFPLNDHSSPNEAILFCLRKLYSQIMEYYELNKYNPENDGKENEDNLKASISVIYSIIGDNNDKDSSPTQISTNPYIKMNSMPIGENKLNPESSTPGFDITQKQVNSFNDNIKHDSNTINSINDNNSINISDNSDGSHSLKESAKSYPTYINNPYKSNNSGDAEAKNKNSQINGIGNDSGGTQFNSTKGSDLKNSD